MMLLRLIEPEAGRITIDGKDLRQISRASLRDAFALVTQEPVLLHDTIQANISFGLPAELGQVEAAARAAGAHGFISGLPEGYLTSVGEAGSRLSGGERQRICIARALLRNPPALILYEATAAVDSATEVEIAASLQELMRGRTSLLISHRLSTVRRADRIVVLDRGKVVALGAFDELVREPGPFQRIFHDQLSVNGVGTGDEGE
jgi:subfamily B ATP-binding cassette protein MsbA